MNCRESYNGEGLEESEGKGSVRQEWHVPQRRQANDLLRFFRGESPIEPFVSEPRMDRIISSPAEGSDNKEPSEEQEGEKVSCSKRL